MRAPAIAQVPVIDSATLSQATQTASNTAAIMNTNQQIMQTVQETLKAVTGSRQTGSMANAALGSGFNMSGAPSLSSILSGGQMAWGNLGEFGQVAAGIINGLKLVNTLTGLSGSSSTGTDKAYQGAVNTATALQGMVSGTQSAASSRTHAFQAAGGQIGTAQDIKGSIDQNSQLQVQTGLTVNELIGVMNSANAALNAQHMQDLAGQAHAAKVLTYHPSSVRLVAP
nr:type IV secretion system protein [Microvirga tunisiensis]